MDNYQASAQYTREQKQAMLDAEFAELQRVGNVPFGGKERELDSLIYFDLSVLDKPKTILK